MKAYFHLQPPAVRKKATISLCYQVNSCARVVCFALLLLCLRMHEFLQYEYVQDRAVVSTAVIPCFLLHTYYICVCFLHM